MALPRSVPRLTDASRLALGVALLLAAGIKTAYPDDPPVPGAPILVALGFRASEFTMLLKAVTWAEALAGGCLVMSLWVRPVSTACAIGYGGAFLVKLLLLRSPELLRSCGCLGRLSRELPGEATLGIDVIVLAVAVGCALSNRPRGSTTPTSQAPLSQTAPRA